MVTSHGDAYQCPQLNWIHHYRNEETCPWRSRSRNLDNWEQQGEELADWFNESIVDAPIDQSPHSQGNMGGNIKNLLRWNWWVAYRYWPILRHLVSTWPEDSSKETYWYCLYVPYLYVHNCHIFSYFIYIVDL